MSAVSNRIQIEYVATSSLIANGWNPNAVDDRTYEAIRESLATYGFLIPVVVRTHPTMDGCYEIVDGEHRWKVAVEEGVTEVPVIKVDHLSESDIKKLTVVLNETKGQADTVPLARLLADLSESMTVDELLIGLPYDSAQLDELLQIGRIDWDAFNAARSDDVEQHLRLAREKNQFTVFLNFDKGQKEKYDACTEILAREKGDKYTAEQAVIDGLARLCKNL